MAIHHLLHRRQVAIQQRPVGEGHQARQQIRIALLGQQVVEQDALLQRRERVDVLDVGERRPAPGDDPVDVAPG